MFRHRNYRLFFSGQLVSLMGTWITNVTQGWLVYSLTHSPLLLGVTSFAGSVPVFFFSAFGGAISDRFDRRRMLLLTQSLACVESAALAILTLTHSIKVWEIICLALFQGFINAFDVPIRQAMTVEMVGKEDLRHAISLNSMMFNLARVIGPSMAGILIALVGVGICFSIDALSYGAVIVSLVMMHFPPRPPVKHAAPLRAVKDGFFYVLARAGNPRLAAPDRVLLGVRRRLSHPAAGLRARCAASGQRRAGLSLYRRWARALSRAPMRWRGCRTGICSPRRWWRRCRLGVSLILFSQSHWFGLSLALLMPAAFSLMLLGGSTNSIIQLLSRDDMRGRVVAFYAMGFLGMMPWGSLMLGWVAEHFGTSRAVAMGGVICILAAVLAWYDRRGAAWKLKTAE